MAAVYCISPAQFPIQKYESFLKYPNKKFMSKRSYVPIKKVSVLRITASIRKKVYEDQSEGIVCYQDECGEIICEGYDEGPCFQRIPDLTYHSRDAKITNLLLRKSWLQIVKGDHNSSDGVQVEGLLQKDLNCNGFNSYC